MTTEKKQNIVTFRVGETQRRQLRQLMDFFNTDNRSETVICTLKELVRILKDKGVLN